jgi:diketogulonate reductase-like aldo/keto reductase
LAHKTITGPGAIHRRTPAQVLFRYLTQIGVVPLTGTKSGAHMREDLSIFDFQLNNEELRAIDERLC